MHVSVLSCSGLLLVLRGHHLPPVLLLLTSSLQGNQLRGGASASQAQDANLAANSPSQTAGAAQAAEELCPAGASLPSPSDGRLRMGG